MVEVLYFLKQEFMVKTLEAIDVHVETAVEQLYTDGYESITKHQEQFLEQLGIPMNGRADERGVAEILEVAKCGA